MIAPGFRSLPYLTRRNYYYEFIHLLPWGVLSGVVEGNLSAIVVAKTFDGGDFLVATAAATPIGALLLSMVFGIISVGRPKLRLALLFGAGAAVCAASVALIPRTPYGGVFFVIQMGLAQLFLCGVVTLRSALWKRNYPAGVRGMIAARLQALRMAAGVGALLVFSALFDMNPEWYREAYVFAGISGMSALLVLRRIHVRGERSELSSMARDAGDNAPARVSLREAFWPANVLRRMREIVRTDRRYARYLSAQMLLGTGVQMTIPVLVITLDQAFHLYWISAVLVDVIPHMATFGSLRRWGPLFDRIPLPRFRVYTGLVAATAMIFGFFATLVVTHGAWMSPSVAYPLVAGLFALRAIAHGVQRGGGSLAWNLGHLHFSSRADAELYMGVHMTLTGVRGIVAPFLGVGLAQLIGGGVWGVGCVMCLMSTWAFHRMSKADTTPQ